MAFRPDIDSLILAALENGESHGYGIARSIEKATNGNIGIQEGRLYPALHKLSEKGFVTSYWIEETSKPSRRIYKLTPAGNKYLEESRKKWSIFVKNVGSALNTKGE